MPRTRQETAESSEKLLRSEDTLQKYRRIQCGKKNPIAHNFMKRNSISPCHHRLPLQGKAAVEIDKGLGAFFEKKKRKLS